MNIAELRRDSQSTDLSPIFERLQTLCTGSTYNLPQCRSKCFNDSINACLSTLQLSSGPFDEVNFSNSCDFMVLAMQLTGLIPVNVEGRGDCFYLAFWYGFAGELASFEQRLEMRRMVAQVFLSKCESEPELLPLLKSEESFAVFRDLGDAEFIELFLENSEISPATTTQPTFLNSQSLIFRKHLESQFACGGLRNRGDCLKLALAAFQTLRRCMCCTMAETITLRSATNLRRHQVYLWIVSSLLVYRFVSFVMPSIYFSVWKCGERCG